MQVHPAALPLNLIDLAFAVVLTVMLAPRLSLLVGGLAAMAAGWGLRFQPSPDTVAWRRGAVGERRTARLLGPLERQGWVVLHDLAVPGSRANLDHLMIGPGGVFVVDSKHYRGRLQLDPTGRLWHGRYPLASTVQAVSFEADRAARVLADPQVMVPIVAVHGAQVPWGKVVTQGVPVVSARRLPSMLRTLPAVLGPNGSPPWPTKLGSASTPPLDPRHAGRLSSLRLVAKYGVLGLKAWPQTLQEIGPGPLWTVWRSWRKSLRGSPVRT